MFYSSSVEYFHVLPVLYPVICVENGEAVFDITSGVCLFVFAISESEFPKYIVFEFATGSVASILVWVASYAF